MFPYFKVTKIVCLVILVFNSSSFFAQSTTPKKELKKTKSSSDSTHRKNYKINFKTIHQPSHDFVNEQGVDYELSRKNISLHTGYDFIFDPFSPEGRLEYYEPNQAPREWDLNKRTIYRNHHAMVNMEIKLSAMDKLLLNQQFNYTHTDKKDRTSDRDLEKKMQRDHQVKSYHFSQVWQHRLTEATTIEMGGIENFIFIKNPGKSHMELQSQTQHLETKATGIEGFASLQHQNLLGTSKATLQYQGLSIKEEGQQRLDQSLRSPIFQYQENLLSFQLTHHFALSRQSELDLGMRIENPHIKKNAAHVKEGKRPSHQKENHTDFSYHLSYTFTTLQDRVYTISLEKIFIRPTYDQLNPITTLYYDLINTSGSLNVQPTQEYKISVGTTQKDWMMSLYAGYAKNLIVNYYTLEDQQLLLTNANFNNPFFAGINMNYAHDFFSGFWNSHTNLQLAYRRMEVEQKNAMRNAPRLKVHTAHAFNFGKAWKAGFDFTYASNYKDSFIKHFNYTQLDVFVEKKIGENLKISIFGEDIFKANRKWEQFRVQDAFFSRNINLDHNTYGVSLQYRIKGKRFQPKNIAKPKDPLLPRIL